MFDHALTLAGNHWHHAVLWILGLLTFVPGLIWAWYKWRRRVFTHVLNASLNFKPAGGDLFAFATLDETRVGTLFDAYARLRLMHLARQQTAFLHFHSEQEAWTFLNVVLNHLSSKFAEGALWYSLGKGQAMTVVIGITCERHNDLKTRKFRVMLASPELLAEIYAGGAPQYKNPRHNGIRGKTLQEMAALWHDPALKHNLMPMTLYLKND